MKRILNIIFWLGIGIGTLVTLGFVSSSQSERICNVLDISIDHSNGMRFLSNEDVVAKLKQGRNYPVGMNLREIKLGEIEKQLKNISEVEDAEVFKSINGNIGIRITQRLPIVRVMNINGRSFYIDNNGMQMPVSEKYAPRVLVVNGYISEPFIEQSAYEIAADSSMRASFKTDDIFAMAQFINKDPFWNAQIQEIYFTPQGEMELIPVVGDHRIVFGDTTNMEKKFNKLMVFYKDGIKGAGWNSYDTVNLKYKNQIVCTKRNNN